MTKPVAKVGQVLPTPGTMPLSPAVSGAWVPGPVVYTEHAKIKIGSVSALHKAECTFTFTGTDPNGVVVTGTEDVALEAGSTKLTAGGLSVLVDGDQEQGQHQNKLAVVAVNKLKTG